jgi:hypothetical protein
VTTREPPNDFNAAVDALRHQCFGVIAAFPRLKQDGKLALAFMRGDGFEHTLSVPGIAGLPAIAVDRGTLCRARTL